MKKFLVLAFAAVMLASCAAAPDESEYYLLTGAEVRAASCEANLGALDMPDYLSRTNIVVQTGTHTLTPASTHRWAEDLGQASRRLLSACLNHGTAPTVDITVQHLHGSTSGTTILEATWQERSSTNVHTFRDERRQAAKGYEPLVADHQALLSQLCEDICATLSRQQP